jgi:two-component system, cell cycle sensor histidine kinase and response regulator CckA
MRSPLGSSHEAPPDGRSPSQQPWPYLWAVVAVSIGIILRMLLTPVLGTALPFITLFPALFVAAFVGGLGPTLLAAILGILVAVPLFIEPHFRLAVVDPVAQFGVALFSVSGLLTGWLGEARLRAMWAAKEAAQRAETEAARAEEASVRAEEEAARAEEEAARAEEEMLRAEEEAARAEAESQRAARESERVEAILGSITDSFLVLGDDWTITYLNERAAVLWGGMPSDFVGRNYWHVFPENLGGPFDQAYRHAMAKRELVRVRARDLRSEKWLEVTAYPAAEGLTIVGQDVTDRVVAQEATTRLAAIVSSSDDAIIGKQLDGTITSWNAAAERIFGYTAEEMVGRSIYTLIPPELHAAEHDALARVSRGEPVELYEAERIRRDGEHIFIDVSVSPIRDQSGKVVGASSIKRDITEQLRIRAVLAAESSRSQDLAQALDAAQTVVRDLGGRISYWSAGSTRLYGWSPAEALGQVSHLLLNTEFPLSYDAVHAALLERGQWEGEVGQTTRDGRKLRVAVQWLLRRGEGGDAQSVVEVHSDVTARRLAEERARQSERIEVVGQLAGGVAHEANNQMTVVMGVVDFLLRRSDLSDAVLKDIEQIRTAAQRTAAVTAQLLAFSRRQVLQPQVLDLDEVVQALDGVLRRALGERSTLVLQLRGKPGRVRADPGQLDQVLLNLVLNARDAMPLGGRVAIETDVVELNERYVLQHPGVGIRPGLYAVLVVSDTGHGMAPDTLRHIFEPFFTTKPVGKGTGLGLATVYGVVKQSGGYVWAYSEPGQGTTFKVYLPVDYGSPPLDPTSPVPAPAQGEIVLVVEDEVSVREMASRALQRHGYAVIEAGSAREALKLIERNDGDLSLLVTDVVMPGMDGSELAKLVGRIRPGLPVLFMSGYTDDEVVRRGLLDAGKPFLQKPFSPEVLIQRVAELLGQRGRSFEPA